MTALHEPRDDCQSKKSFAALLFCSAIIGLFSLMILSAQTGMASPSRAELQIQALKWLEDGRYDKVVELENQLLKDQPNAPEAFYIRGLAHAGRANNKLEPRTAAIQDFTSAIALNQNNAEYYFRRGEQLCLTERYASAAEDLRKCLKLSGPKTDWRYYHALAVIEYNLNNRMVALDLLNKAIPLAPSPFEFGLRKLRGDWYLAKNDFVKAQSDLERALILKPKEVEVLFCLASCYRSRARWGKSIELLERAIQINKAYTPAYCELASFYQRSRQFSKAIFNCSEAIRIDPKCAIAFVIRADCFRNLGQDERALRDVERAIAVDRKDYYAWLVRGQIQYHLAKNEQAIADFSRAIQLNPKCRDAYYWRGMAYEELGKKELARNDKEVAKRMDAVPSNAGNAKLPLTPR